MLPTAPLPTNQDASEAGLRLSRLQGFLKQDPDNLSLCSQTIAAAIACSQWEVAEQLIQDGLHQHPQAAELLAHAGFVALRKHDYLNAKQYFESALSRGLQAAAVHYNLAFALFCLGEHESALAALEATSQSDALGQERYVLTARCLHHLGKREQAIDVLQNLPARTDEAEGLLALLLHEVDRAEDALSAANRVLASEPKQLDALLARAGTLVEQENFEQAKQDYLTATQAHPHVGRAWSGLAQLEFRDFKFEEALGALKTAVKYMPNHIGTWHTLAWIYILQGDAESAKQAFDKSYDIDRNFGETHGGLAVVAAMQDQQKLAEELIKKATRLNPEGFAAHYASMLLLEKQGKTTESRQLFERVMNTPNAALGVLPRDLLQRRMQELAKKTAH